MSTDRNVNYILQTLLILNGHLNEKDAISSTLSSLNVTLQRIEDNLHSLEQRNLSQPSCTIYVPLSRRRKFPIIINYDDDDDDDNIIAEERTLSPKRSKSPCLGEDDDEESYELLTALRQTADSGDIPCWLEADVKKCTLDSEHKDVGGNSTANAVLLLNQYTNPVESIKLALSKYNEKVTPPPVNTKQLIFPVQSNNINNLQVLPIRQPPPPRIEFSDVLLPHDVGFDNASQIRACISCGIFLAPEAGYLWGHGGIEGAQTVLLCIQCYDAAIKIITPHSSSSSWKHQTMCGGDDDSLERYIRVIEDQK